MTDLLRQTTYFTYDIMDKPSGVTDPLTNTWAYTYDEAGRVTSLHSDAAPAFTYAYDPWGQLLSATETVLNPYRYASYRYDTSTGLYYCWNRYYAPELARFLTRDIHPGELADPVTMNPYLYCGADPVNAVDPSGKAAILVPIAAGLVVLAAIAGLLYSTVPAMEDKNRRLDQQRVLTESVAEGAVPESVLVDTEIANCAVYTDYAGQTSKGPAQAAGAVAGASTPEGFLHGEWARFLWWLEEER